MAPTSVAAPGGGVAGAAAQPSGGEEATGKSPTVDGAPAGAPSNVSQPATTAPPLLYPQRPRGAYVLFQSEVRARVQKQRPGQSAVDIAHRMSYLWEELDRNEDAREQYTQGKAKHHYVAMALADAERYEREMTAYNAASRKQSPMKTAGKRKRGRPRKSGEGSASTPKQPAAKRPTWKPAEDKKPRGWALNDNDDIVISPKKGAACKLPPEESPEPLVLAIGATPGSTIMGPPTCQIRRSTCVCGGQQCKQLSKAFQSVDDVRGQFFTMPKLDLSRSAGLKLHKLDRCIHHLQLQESDETMDEVRERVSTLDRRYRSKGGEDADESTVSTRSQGPAEGTTKLGRPRKGEDREPARKSRFVAMHHFHPSLLQAMVMEKGQYQFDAVDVELVQRLGLEGNGYDADDIWVGKPNIKMKEEADFYVPVPSYSLEDAQRAFISCSSHRRVDTLVSNLRNNAQGGATGGVDTRRTVASRVDGIRPIKALPQLDANNARHMQSAVSVLADEREQLKKKIQELEGNLAAEREAAAARERELVEVEPTTAELLQPYFENDKPFFVQAYYDEGWVVPEDGTVLEFETRTHKRSVTFETARFVPGLHYANLRKKCKDQYKVYKRPGMFKEDRKEKKRAHTQQWSRENCPRGIVEVCVRARDAPPPAFWNATGGDVSLEEQEAAAASGAANEPYINDDGYYEYEDEA